MKNNLPRILIFLFLIISVLIGIYLIQSDFDFNFGSRADFAVQQQKCGRLTARVSLDKTNPTTVVSITPDYPRYYLHLKTVNANKTCATRLAVRTQYCSPDGNCGQWTKSQSWGDFHSGRDGIARIDKFDVFYSNQDYEEGQYYAQFRQAGTHDKWSNRVLVNVTSAAKQEEEMIDPRDYFIYQPGYTYIFTSQNNIYNQTNRLRIQMEERTLWGNVMTIPWRFTKDAVFAYHHPKRTEADSDTNLRWMIVAPEYSFPYPLTNFNNFITSVGEKRYLRENIRDIDSNRFEKMYITGSTDSQIPAYILGLRYPISVPHTYLVDTSAYSTHHETETTPFSGQSLEPFYRLEISPLQNWIYRLEMDEVDIQGKFFEYSGEALRADFFEKSASQSMSENWLLRESWYFVKDIGLVKIETKRFNTDPHAQLKEPIACNFDADCLNDNMVYPETISTLDYFYHNEPLEVELTKDAAGESATAISIRQGESYQLKIKNTPYTGYLEEIGQSGQVRKWYWAEEGLVTIPGEETQNLSPGVYQARFRIWVPDDSFSAEQRVGNTQIAWSNNIEVEVLASSDQEMQVPVEEKSLSLTPTSLPDDRTAKPTQLPTPVPTKVEQLSLQVEVSAGGQRGSQITIGQNEGYSLHILNRSYTGYLEALNQDGEVFKWYRAVSGKVDIPAEDLSGLAPGSYRAKFRPWQEDSNSWLWSNEITVNIR